VRFRRVPGRPVGPRTLALAAVGGVLIGAGAAAMIASDLGVTPWDVLTTAVADRAGVSVGVSAAGLSVLVYALCAPLGRLPGWGNAVLLVAVSGAVDGALALLCEPDAWAGRALLYAAGVPVVCLGVALVVVADIGVGPLEMAMLVATDRAVPLVRARVVIEATTLAVGTALGGALGLGTAGFALAAGPLIAGWLRLLGAAPGPRRLSAVGGEELEPGDGEVAQHREAEGDDDAGHERRVG
jgi:uncharacterized membrane protein YczE